MNLSSPFILRPVMTTLVMLAVFALGLMAHYYLPVSNLPDVNYPAITVTVAFPGANPVTMANTVATPLEKQFMTIPGVRYVTSNSNLGSTTIILQFDIDKNIDLAAVDVESAITAAIPQLPPNLPQAPTYKKINPSATPVVYIAVSSSTLTQGQLYDYANTLIGQRISIIDGVSQVQVFGSPTAVRVQLDPAFIASLGITQEEVSRAITNQNQYLPLGQFDGTYKATTIYDNGGLLKAVNYRPVIVTYKNGAPVRVQDIATVVDSLQKDRSVRRFIRGDMDAPCVILGVQRQPGANTVEVASAVRSLLSKLENELPGSLDLDIVFDRSLSIRESIHDVEITLFIAFILVVLVIYMYLGRVRDTIIPALVMPMSIICTLAIIYPLGYTLDSLSLLALTLSIGFIIDDAIVVLENIVRRVEGGETPMIASLEGAKQISFTIISMTLSLIAVFIPLLFMAGLIGKLFEEFAVTLTIVTLASGIISLTLTPMLCAKFIPPSSQSKEGRMIKFSKKMNDRLLHYYKNALSWVLKHPSLMLVIGVLSIIISLVLVKVMPKDFIPDDDIGFVIAYAEAEQGTSSDQMTEYQQQIINALRHDPAIATLTSISATPVFRQGIIFMSLIPKKDRKSTKELIVQFSQKVNKIPGVNVYFRNVPLIDLNIGSQVRGSYQYLMQSLDSEQLYKAAQTLIDQMKNDPTFEGISTDMEVKTPQVNLDIQRDYASTLGIDVTNFETSLALGYSGNRISRIQTPIDQYDVILELNRDLQRKTSSLDLIYLRSNTTNQLVPLNAIANWTEGVGPASINHFSQFPSVTITFNIDSKVPLSDALANLRELASKTLTASVHGDVKGTAEIFEEAVMSIEFLLIITVFTIYIVLGILYESYIHPLTILSTLPPAVVGGLLTLYVLGLPISMYAFLGVILLIGIVKKNGIMMVDFALDNIRTRGESPEKSIFDACVVRFRPIMMTTVAAIMGAVPIAVGFGAGAESRRPLGLVIIGGMIVSQLITLFLTPVIFLYFERLREKYISKTPKEV